MVGAQHPETVSSGIRVDEELTPDEVVHYPNWTRREKLERLEKMKLDAEALLRSSAEGMSGGEQIDLQEVERAIDTVQNQSS